MIGQRDLALGIYIRMDERKWKQISLDCDGN